MRYPDLPAGTFRHPDHRFEWIREQFRAWGDAAADDWGYRVFYLPVGPEDRDLGAPTQLALLQKAGS